MAVGHNGGQGRPGAQEEGIAARDRAGLRIRESLVLPPHAEPGEAVSPRPTSAVQVGEGEGRWGGDTRGEEGLPVRASSSSAPAHWRREAFPV